MTPRYKAIIIAGFVLIALMSIVSGLQADEFCGDRYCVIKQTSHVTVTFVRRHKREHVKKHRKHWKGSKVESREREVTLLPHPVECPRTNFCGCATALEIFGRNIRELWLSSNWFRFPAAEPAPGMVAVKRGHVFAIRKIIRPGVVLAYDPNSGKHKTRLHERSLRGFRVVNPYGSKFASAS
jgi:hypothetical protein